MSFGNFGSAWREKAFYTDPDAPVHIADPAHGEKHEDQNPVWDAPADVHTYPDYLYDSLAVEDGFVADSTGQILDASPYSHDHGADFSITPFGPETTAANAAVAGMDHGSSRADTYQVPPMQDATTTYINKRFEGLGETDVSPTALIRGLNSNSVNNPDGFRKGWVEQSFVDRKFYEGERKHDRRLLTPNLPFAQVDQEPVVGLSPYSSLAKMFTSISQNPMIRREPVSMSESITTDGTEQAYQQDAPDWVTG